MAFIIKNKKNGQYCANYKNYQIFFRVLQSTLLNHSAGLLLKARKFSNFLFTFLITQWEKNDKYVVQKRLKSTFFRKKFLHSFRGPLCLKFFQKMLILAFVAMDSLNCTFLDFSSLCKKVISRVIYYPKQYLFVGRKSSDFTDEIPDELIVVGLLALVLGRTFLQFIGRGLMTFFQTGADFVFWRHSVRKKNNKKLDFFSEFYVKILNCLYFSDRQGNRNRIFWLSGISRKMGLRQVELC